MIRLRPHLSDLVRASVIPVLGMGEGTHQQSLCSTPILQVGKLRSRKAMKLFSLTISEICREISPRLQPFQWRVSLVLLLACCANTGCSGMFKFPGQ